MSHLSPQHTNADPARRPIRTRGPTAGAAVALTLSSVLVGAAGGGAAVAAEGAESADGAPPLCLYVSSYHRGYSWSDGVERGLREGLEGHCEIVQIDMDSKRRKDEADIVRAADSAMEAVRRLRPDVIITSDDNAAKFLIVPHLDGGETPVIFCGINWTVEEYGFPTDNVTGIVEIAPIRPMIREALTLVPDGRRAAYVGGLTLTESKNYHRIAEVTADFGVSLDSILVESFSRWKEAFEYAHDNYDFVVVGSHSGLVDWDDDAAAAHARKVSHRPSLTNHEWMMPVTLVGYTKLPEEHGERAAVMARAVLGGTAVTDLPLITNRKWDTWLNDALRAVVPVPVPERIARHAKRADIGPDAPAPR